MLTVEENAASIVDLQSANNTIFLLFSTALVFFMQAGFAMLCAGSIRAKNVKNILLKNVLDAAVGAIFWYLFGYGIAFGVPGDGNSGRFMGEADFALGISAVGLRMETLDVPLPMVFRRRRGDHHLRRDGRAHAVRRVPRLLRAPHRLRLPHCRPLGLGRNGWLKSVPWKKDDGDKSLAYYDFAGSGVVHMIGGFAGLMGAIMVGPRTGRFDAQGRPIAMPGHNAALVVLGTFILWVGWYGFNCGSQLRDHRC